MLVTFLSHPKMPQVWYDLNIFRGVEVESDMESAVGSSLPLALTQTVTISLDQLREFKAAVAAVPILKAKLAKRTPNNLAKVREFDAAHPEKAAERQRRYNSAHREELNAKRREKRRLAREAVAAAGSPVLAMATTPPPST